MLSTEMLLCWGLLQLWQAARVLKDKRRKKSTKLSARLMMVSMWWYLQRKSCHVSREGMHPVLVHHYLKLEKSKNSLIHGPWCCCWPAVGRGEILSRSTELTKGGTDSLGILSRTGTSADTLPRRATHAATEERGPAGHRVVRADWIYAGSLSRKWTNPLSSCQPSLFSQCDVNEPKREIPYRSFYELI